MSYTERGWFHIIRSGCVEGSTIPYHRKNSTGLPDGGDVRAVRSGPEMECEWSRVGRGEEREVAACLEDKLRWGVFGVEAWPLEDGIPFPKASNSPLTETERVCSPSRVEPVQEPWYIRLTLRATTPRMMEANKPNDSASCTTVFDHSLLYTAVGITSLPASMPRGTIADAKEGALILKYCSMHEINRHTQL